MSKRPRIALKQHIPDGIRPVFTPVEVKPGANFWEAVTADVYGNEIVTLSDNRPVYRLTIPKKSKLAPPAVREIALAAALQCGEGRGLVWLTEYSDNVPVASFAFAANGRTVICVFSTDPDRCPAENPEDLIRAAQEKLEQAQADRRKTRGAA